MACPSPSSPTDASSPSCPARAFARVVLLTRDEYDLIGDFLEFYGRVVGRENVVVVDNGSTHPVVLSAYARHISLGGPAPIVEPRSFRDACSFMSEHLRALAPTCEWLLPMETDEFVYVMGGGSGVFPESVRLELVRHLGSQPRDVGVLQYGRVLRSLVDPSDPGYSCGAYTRPVCQVRRFAEQGWDKLAIRSAAFEAMSMWCHHAQLAPGYRVARSDRLGLLHLHDTGSRRLVERAVPVTQAYGYADMLHGTLSEQLTKTLRLSSAPVACGHKAGILARHLLKRATLVAFRTWVGRLPDPDELARYSDPSESAGDGRPEHAVRRDAAAGKIRSEPVGGALGWRDLLYSEPRQTEDVEETFSIHLSRASVVGFV